MSCYVPLGLASVLLSALAGLSLNACLALGRNGVPVGIGEETAILIWDAETKTEHFIRRAKFVTESKNLGFLVPTPTKPDLVDVGDAAFHELYRFTTPPPPVPPDRSTDAGGKPPKSNRVLESVRVLEQKKVGDYDATILAADDAKSLTEWLKKNDYPSSPEIADWLTPYLKDKWILTAYKISTQAKGVPDASGFHGSTIRMSFKADKPFYPYREPKNAGESAPSNRLLRVYFLSQEPHDATLVDARWTQAIPFAGRLTAMVEEALLRQLKLPARLHSNPLFLTEFEDTTRIRST
ncbi:MAG: DUF2330 domain-containing protein, partial [Gemmataceae bacterium]|nr:DUF2330 domain-containing protein [Gemmataceae bacterium]